DRVLDVWSGSRPYDDLLPPDAEVVSLDVEGNPYGVADVVCDEFLPFPDGSFDGVLFVQAFDLVPDPPAAVAELARVLRPGGWAVVTVPFVWEYDRRGPDRRYTAGHLASLFGQWDDADRVARARRRAAAASARGGARACSLRSPLRAREHRRPRPRRDRAARRAGLARPADEPPAHRAPGRSRLVGAVALDEGEGRLGEHGQVELERPAAHVGDVEAHALVVVGARATVHLPVAG